MSQRFATIGVAAAVLCVDLAAAKDQSEQFKGAGMPLLFIVCFAAAIVMSHKQLLAAHEVSKGTRSLAWVFRGALLTSAVSIFLYPTPAWPYGLMSTVICYYVALVCASNSIHAQGRIVLLIILGWFCVLVGVPSALGEGIIGVLHSSNCNAFYGAYSDKMCRAGWLTFATIVGGVQIGLTFLSLLTIMSAGAEEALGGGEGTYHVVADTETFVASTPKAVAGYGGAASGPANDDDDASPESGYHRAA